MLPTRMLTAVLCVTAAGAAALAPLAASAQSNCHWYAETALRQQQRNLKGRCGFSGPGWSSDLRSHIAWCNSVSPDVWKRAAQERERQLQHCGR